MSGHCYGSRLNEGREVENFSMVSIKKENTVSISLQALS